MSAEHPSTLERIHAAAQRYLEELNDFFTAGWARIMGQA